MLQISEFQKGWLLDRRAPQSEGEAVPIRALTVSLAPQTFTPKLVLLDLADISCVQDVAKEVLDCYGCVDILINNASVKVKGPADKISLELDKKIMDANYFGPITLTKGLVSLTFLWTSGPPAAREGSFMWTDGHLILDEVSSPSQKNPYFCGGSFQHSDCKC